MHILWPLLQVPHNPLRPRKRARDGASDSSDDDDDDYDGDYDSDDGDAVHAAKSKPRPPPPQPYYRLVEVDGAWAEREVKKDGTNGGPMGTSGIRLLVKKAQRIKKKLERISVSARALGFEYEMLLLEVRPKKQGSRYVTKGVYSHWTGGFYDKDVMYNPRAKAAAQLMGSIMVSSLISAKKEDDLSQVRTQHVLPDTCALGR